MNYKNTVLCLSGAADKIGFHFGFAYALHEQNKLDKFQAYCGTSSGSIIAFMVMCGDMEKGKELILNFTPKKHIFGYNPFGLRGIGIASYNILRGKTDGLWRYNNLEKTLRKATSIDRFEKYKGGCVFVGITRKDGSVYYQDLRGLSYDNAIKAVLKSASIPVVVNTIDGEMDGGVVDHIGTPKMADIYNTSDFISVFARENKPFSRKKSSRIISSLLWVIDRMTHDVSINDEYISDLKIKARNKNHHKYFMSSSPVKGMFKIKKQDNIKLFMMGYGLL